MPRRPHHSLLSLTAVTVTGALVSAVAGPSARGQEDDGAPPSIVEAADDGEPGDDAPPETPGHRRMREALMVVRDRADRENPYVGRQQARMVSSQLNQLPADAPLDMRWQMMDALAQQEMAAGNTAAAIELYTQAKRFVPRMPEPQRRTRTLQTNLRLGVAYLVKGERENCVQCHDTDSCIFPIQGNGVHEHREGSREATAHFKQVVRNSEPTEQIHVIATWLLNIAVMTLGEYPKGVPKNFRIKPSAFPKMKIFPRFTDAASRLGLDTFNLSGGSIVDDFDDDGDLDLFNTTWDPMGRALYFESDGAGGYEEQGVRRGLEGLLGGLNTVQADYDNDGDLDVLVLRGAWMRQFGTHPNSLLRNEAPVLDGDGAVLLPRHFVDVTFELGLGEVHYPTQNAAWADYDLDGDLDLFIGNEATSDVEGEDTRYPCQLFRNDAPVEGTDGSAGTPRRFVDVAEEAGVQNFRWAKGCSWGDFDGDRDPDLYVSNMKGENRLYRNDGGEFVDVAPELGLTGPHESFPTWFWDYDNDGHLDLFCSCYVLAVEDVAADYMGLEPDTELPAIYHNDGQGGFALATEELGFSRVTATMGANFGDIDGDGYLDFYLGTGYPDYLALMPNLMFWNRGGTRFVDVTYSGGFGHLQKGHAISFADIDNDGDVDVFEQLGGAFRGDGFHNALFENPGFGNSWITLRLVGTTSNRCAIGTRIRAVITEGDATRSIYRHVNSGGSFGANPLRLTLGVGKATSIDRLEVEWPASATTQVFEDVEVGRFLRITEGSDEFEVLELRSFDL